MEAIKLIVNCDEEFDVMAFFALKARGDLPEKIKCNVGLWLEDAESELNEHLKVQDERIKTVGPLPRFVLDDDKTFNERRADLTTMRNGNDDSDRTYYVGMLACKMKWQRYEAKRRLVKLVRV
ncbi:hypothetical protein TRVL_08283 [Trypanosoma vivax]|nr:hypothetical protein TRVL_08283 [Trypanosoma vivax]